MPVVADSEAGFIIHSRPFKEKSLLLELYTLNYGRISAVARVSKASATRSLGVYQPFIPLKLYLRQGRSSLWQLTEAIIQRQSFNIAPPKIFSAIYLNELLYYLTIPQDPEPHLFAAYLDALERLEKDEDEFMILRYFEEILIESLGYAPNYETISGDNFKSDSFYIYLPKNGFIESSDVENLLFSGKDLICIKNRDFSERNTRIALKKLIQGYSGFPFKWKETKKQSSVFSISDGEIMVTFYKPVKKENVKKAVKVECSDLDLQGRGVARDGDNVYFVPGLMPGDTANVLSENSKGKIHQGKITKIIKPSENRREKDCPLIGQCGGCQMQHVPVEQLIEAKIAGIRKLFKKALNFDIGEASFVHSAEELGYRRACRFAIRGDHGKLYLGFREEKSHDLVKIKTCRTLSDRMNNAIEPLNKAINSLNLKNKLGHVELLDSDGALGVLVRFSATVDDHDVSVLESTGKALNAVISIVEPYRNPLEIKKKESLRERFICGSIDDLYIISHGVKIKCNPSSFVQINKKINDKLLDTVVRMIEPNKNTSVMDLFCGLGNFAMPLAKEGANVVGVDIVAKMIEDARANAKEQNLENVKFEVADLEELFENQKWAKADYDAVVLDPGREGAKRATLFLAKKKVKKIVYISCNPLAASRDTIELIKSGYKIKQWGVCDMFPRTTHVEMVLEFTL